MPVCIKCQSDKAESEFHRSKKAANGCQSRCKNCATDYHKDRYLRDRDKLLEQNKAWRERSWDTVLEIAARGRARKRTSIMWQLERRMLRKMDRYARHGLSRQVRCDCLAVLGYTFEELRAHIEKQFKSDMTWKGIVSGKIEIDHVVPRSAFYYESASDPDFQACWAITNFQPLWRKENRSKCDSMPDGRKGGDVGRARQDLYERRLIQMSVGAILEPWPDRV